MEKEAGFTYLRRLLGNKLHVIFIKTMSSHRIYIVFELGANGSRPVLNAWFVGRKQGERCYVVHCVLLLRLSEKDGAVRSRGPGQE